MIIKNSYNGDTRNRDNETFKSFEYEVKERLELKFCEILGIKRGSLTFDEMKQEIDVKFRIDHLKLKKQIVDQMLPDIIKQVKRKEMAQLKEQAALLYLKYI